MPTTPISRRARPPAATAAAVALLTLTATSFAQGLVPDADDQTRLLIDDTLAQRPVRLVAISADALTLRDATGRTSTLPLARAMALVPEARRDALAGRATRERTWREADHASARVVGRAVLTDGQSLPGSPLSDPTADHLAWRSRLWGVVSIPLDALAVAQLRAQESAAPLLALRRPRSSGANDAVLLVNGDRIEGFVASIIGPTTTSQPGARPRDNDPPARGSAGSVTLEINKTASTIPLDRVDGVVFANPATEPRGAWIWLHDGTAARVESILMPADAPATIRPPALLARQTAEQPEPITLRGPEIRAVLFDAARLRPLASLPNAPTGPTSGPASGSGPTARGEVRVGDAEDAPIGAADVELIGPVSWDWTLPPGATRVAWSAELPPAARIWGDCTLVVTTTRAGDPTAATLLRQRFNADTPTHDANVALPPDLPPGTRLTLAVEPGPAGPVQNRVTLRRPLVLNAARPPSPASPTK